MNAAFATLWESLVVVCRLIAPMVPFVSDWVHRQLTGAKSVHLAGYPVSGGRRDRELEGGMEVVRRLAGLGRAARESAGIRVRQPLRRIWAALPRGALHPDGELLDVLRDELNVREVEFVAEPSELVLYRAEPEFAVLGPRFGKQARTVAAAIRELSPPVIAAWHSGDGDLTLEVEGAPATIPREAIRLTEEPRAGLIVQSETGFTVGLDIRLDDDLRREGTARELVNRIQRLRRDAGLEVDDRIRLGIFGSAEVAEAARVYRDYIAGEVLAVDVEIGEQAPASGYSDIREVQFDGKRATIGVERR